MSSLSFLLVRWSRDRVQHPEQVRDVAKAVAWVQTHIKVSGYSLLHARCNMLVYNSQSMNHSLNATIQSYYPGADLDRVFISGHSAGGHLASLVALDTQYLKEAGVRPDFIKVMSLISHM